MNIFTITEKNKLSMYIRIIDKDGVDLSNCYGISKYNIITKKATFQKLIRDENGLICNLGDIETNYFKGSHIQIDLLDVLLFVKDIFKNLFKIK